MSSPQATLKRKRHYKKDTSYLYDLYTLTFDENETLESLDETVSWKHKFILIKIKASVLFNPQNHIIFVNNTGLGLAYFHNILTVFL